MASIKDLTGQQFHNLLALRPVGQDKNYHAIWLFRCLRCGGTLEAPGYAVSRPDSEYRACGCSPQGQHKRRREERTLCTA